MLKWKLKTLEEHAHMLAYKQGIIHNPQKLWRSEVYESVTTLYTLKLHAKWCYTMQHHMHNMLKASKLKASQGPLYYNHTKQSSNDLNHSKQT